MLVLKFNTLSTFSTFPVLLDFDLFVCAVLSETHNDAQEAKRLWKILCKNL